MSARNEEKTVFVDTNIFLRVLVKENERMFIDCREVLTLISKGSLAAFTNTVVLVEIQFVLTTVYKQSREKVKEALIAVLSVPNMKIIDDTDAHLALSLFSKTNVKFTDCLIASSKRLQIRQEAILSYDRDFDRLHVSRIEPWKLAHTYKESP